MTDHFTPSRRYFAIAISVLFVGVSIFVLAQNKTRILELANIPARFLILASTMFFANIVVRATLNWRLFRARGFKVPFIPYLAMFFYTTGMSFFVPASGSVYSAKFMMRFYQVDTAEFVGIYGSFSLLLALAGSIVGVILVISAWLLRGFLYSEILVLLFLTIAVVCSLRSRHFRKFLLRFTSASAIVTAHDGMHALLNNRQMQLISGASIVGLIATTYAAIWALFQGAELAAHPTQLLILVVSQILSGIIPISPGGIGFQEAAALFFGAAMEFSLIDLLFVFVLWRVLRMLLLLVLFGPARLYLSRLPRNA